jgi:hypothetical protein
MADQADAVALHVEAQLGLEGGEDVLPDGVARAGVVEADVLAKLLGLEGEQVVEVVLAQVLLRPAGGELGPPGELVERQVAAHGHVVVADQADPVGGAAGQDAALVRRGAVADDVAEAPDLGDAGLHDVVQHRLQRLAIPVDIGDDSEAHGDFSRRRRDPTSIPRPRANPGFGGTGVSPARRPARGGS